MTTNTPSRAIIGRCPKCGVRTARGEMPDGSLAEAEICNLTAAGELRALADGHVTYRAIWKNYVTIAARTRRDVKVNPAGYDGSRIWKEHRCDTRTPLPAEVRAAIDALRTRATPEPDNTTEETSE